MTVSVPWDSAAPKEVPPPVVVQETPAEPVVEAEEAKSTGSVHQASGHPVQKWWAFFASESFLLALFAALPDYGISIPSATQGLLMLAVGGIVGYKVPRKAGE